MNKKEPVVRRLTNDQFIQPSSSFQIYLQHINEFHELHWHEFYELCFVISGEGANVVNGAPYALRPGSLFLLTPADFHEIYSQSGAPMSIYNVVFSHEFLTPELRELLFTEIASYMADTGDEAANIQAQYQLIWEETRETKLGQRLLVKGALERILLLLARMCRRTPSIPAASGADNRIRHVQNALVYIHHHFREALTLGTAARQAGLTPNYFSHVFRRTTGVPFQSYLQELRLKFAKALITASDIPITEICYVSGFNTLTHFERAFKHTFEVSPSSYRHKAADP